MIVKRNKIPKIVSVEPQVILKGARIELKIENPYPVFDLEDKHLFIGNHNMRFIAASLEKIQAEVLFFSEKDVVLPITLKMPFFSTKPKNVFIPIKLSENHIFGSSPVCDNLGNIYFIDLRELQGGQQSVIYKYILEQQKLVPYLYGIPAPTSLAFFDGVLFITSMAERKLYRCVALGEFEVFSQGLGNVFGIAINRIGEIFVGDQSGSLFKIDSTGKASFFASIPDSFKGYHFCVSPEDEIYFSVPSSIGKNSIYKINSSGKLETILETMHIVGGIAFCPEGNFYWIENTREEGAIFRKNKQGKIEKVFSSSFVLGLCFNPVGDMILTDLHNIYLARKEWFKKEE